MQTSTPDITGKARKGVWSVHFRCICHCALEFLSGMSPKYAKGLVICKGIGHQFGNIGRWQELVDVSKDVFRTPRTWLQRGLWYLNSLGPHPGPGKHFCSTMHPCHDVLTALPQAQQPRRHQAMNSDPQKYESRYILFLWVNFLRYL